MNINDEEDVLFAYVVKKQGPQMVVVVIIIDSINKLKNLFIISISIFILHYV